MHRVTELIDDAAHLRPSAGEYELAYHAHVAIDRIRFAIRHVEQFGKPCDQMRDTNLQLLDALEGLETAELRFQVCSRRGGSKNGNGTERTA
jgi:hypothetical protein